MKLLIQCTCSLKCWLKKMNSFKCFGKKKSKSWSYSDTFDRHCKAHLSSWHSFSYSVVLVHRSTPVTHLQPSLGLDIRGRHRGWERKFSLQWEWFSVGSRKLPGPRFVVISCVFYSLGFYYQWVAITRTGEPQTQSGHQHIEVKTSSDSRLM